MNSDDYVFSEKDIPNYEHVPRDKKSSSIINQDILKSSHFSSIIAE